MAEPRPIAVVATLGESPAVVTRMMDYFLLSQPPVLVRELTILHSGGDSGESSLRELATSFKGIPSTHLCGSHSFPGSEYVGDMGATPLPLILDGLDVGDLLDQKSNNRMLALLCRHVWRLRHAGYDVIMNIAGGRKTQSAYALLAGMLFGASRVVHLVTKPEYVNENRKLHVPLNHFTLIDVPVPSLAAAQAGLLGNAPPQTDDEILRHVYALKSSVPALLALGRSEARLEAPDEIELPPGIPSASPRMMKVISGALQCAASGFPIFLHGPPGSGRERLAKGVGLGTGGIGFETVDARSLKVEDLTGRGEGDRGLLERCAGGTLYLKDLDQVPKTVEHFLLSHFTTLPKLRISAPGGRKAGVREPELLLICSGTASLSQRIQEGKLSRGWRDDVFRTESQVIEMPSLEERREEFPLLVRDILEHNAKRYSTGRAPLPPALVDEAIEQLKCFGLGNLQVNDLSAELAVWAAEKKPDVRDLLERLGKRRTAPWQDALEAREQNVLSWWFRIRRNPTEAASLKAKDAILLAEVEAYARAHYETHRKEYPNFKSLGDFSAEFFGKRKKAKLLKQNKQMKRRR